MSTDKFQKQVESKMDELRLSPNPQVWVEVERRIREKKKRRVIIFWFLFAGLLLAGGSLWLLNQPGGEKQITLATKKNNDNTTTNNLTDTKTEISKPITNTTDKKTEPVTTQQQPGSDKKDEIKPEQTRQPISIQNIAKQKPEENNRPVIVKTKKEKTSNSQPAIVGTKPADIKQAKDDIAVNTTQAQTELSNKPASDKPGKIDPARSTIANKTDNVVSIQPPVTDLAKDAKLDKPVDSTSKTDAVNEQPVAEIKNNSDKKPFKKNKWQLGVSTALGNARLTQGEFLDLNMSKSADMYVSPNTGSGQTNAPPVSRADSIPLSGPYWHIGVNAKKQLGKKTAFSAGINFATYTTKQRVGSFVDSVNLINNDLRSQTFGGFYRAGQTTVFKNHYYFIQLPLLLHWQINRGEKLPPISWENGFLPSFLIGSNALSYDQGSTTFYKDKRLYNDVQLSYYTGLNAGLFKNSKHPLSLGVFYNYNFSMLQKLSPPNYNYLNSFGIKVNWLINK